MTSMAATAFAAIAQAMSVASRLNEINKKIGDAEFSNLLADLQLELAEAKAKIADLVVENSDLRGRIAGLEGAAAVADQMEFDGVVYRKSGDVSAYCPPCWEAKHLQIRLNQLHGDLADLAKYTCPNCKAPAGITM
jgi:hypothetical protein